MDELPPELKPTQIRRVMDLAEQAGLDVSDWATNFSGIPASNPKYCYEWAYQGANDVIICNLWYDEMSVVHGNVEDRVSFLTRPSRRDAIPVRVARRNRMKAIIGYAYANKLPIRVIVLDGQRRAEGKSTKITGRLLDPKKWTVVKYSDAEIVLRRGQWASEYADQFSLDTPPPEGDGAASKGMTTRRKRSADVREWVLRRAKGSCEHCGEQGFLLADGRRYLETHHIIPLSEKGKDNPGNVIALCANDHRKAHHSADKDALAKAFTITVGQKERK